MMEIVKACCENQEMVIVKYDENNEDLFLCGYIKQYNEKEIIMKCVNERGQYDGYAILMASRIWRMNYEGKKIERIHSLFERQKYTGGDIEYKGAKLIYDMLEFAEIEKLIVTVITIDTEIEGYVKKYDDKTILIKKIDEFGLEQGCSVTNIDKILYLFADTREGRNRGVLCRERNGHNLLNAREHKRNNAKGLMDIIDYCCCHNFVTSIYDYDSEQSEDGNWVGIIDGFNKKEILFRHISVDGEDDGYVWKRMDSVCGIAHSGKYENKIETLYKHTNQECMKIKRKKPLLLSLLKYSKKKKYIISMITAYGIWTGFIKKCDERVVELKVLDKYANENGILMVKYNDIDIVRCNGGDERDVLTLYRSQA